MSNNNEVLHKHSCAVDTVHVCNGSDSVSRYDTFAKDKKKDFCDGDSKCNKSLNLFLSVEKDNFKDEQIAMRTLKKKQKLDSLPKIKVSSEHILQTNYLKNNYVVFEDPFNGQKILEVHDSINGGIHYLDKDSVTFSCMLLPRQSSLSAIGRKHLNLCKVLDKLHTFDGAQINRKIDKGNNSPSSVYGKMVLQGSVGLSKQTFPKNKEQEYNTLIKFINRMEHALCEYVDTRALNGIKNNRHIVNWKGLTNENLCAASLATSKNYYSHAHMDKSFFFTMHQVNVPIEYKSKMPVCQYFCFPQFGLAIAIRPGDILLFNPNIYHCLSMKTENYKTDVHVTSAYIKTAHTGDNNNRQELTDIQDHYFHAYTC